MKFRQDAFSLNKKLVDPSLIVIPGPERFEGCVISVIDVSTGIGSIQMSLVLDVEGMFGLTLGDMRMPAEDVDVCVGNRVELISTLGLGIHS